MRIFHDSFLKIIDENKEIIFEKMKTNPDFFDTVFQSSIDKGSKIIFNNLDKNKKDMLRDVRRVSSNYNRRLYKSWAKPIDNLETIIELVSECMELYLNDFSDKAMEEQNILFYIFKGIQARALIISKECLVLLRNGYPDGAFSLWRSLYELSVIAIFLYENREDKDLCQRYLDFAHIQRYKEENKCRECGYPTYSEEDFKKLKFIYDKFIDIYGKNFSQGEYGWANKKLNKTNANFYDIESATDMNKFRGYYKSSSAYIHGNYKAIEEPMGLFMFDKLLLAGASNYGLSIPMQNVAISLVNIAVLFLSIYPIVDYIIAGSILNIFTSILIEESDKVQCKIEAEEMKFNKKNV